eukprot:894809_1
MALQLAAGVDFNLNSVQTRELLTSSGISKSLEKNYPKLNELIKYNAVGAVKLLVASGAITGGIKKSEFKITREIHNNSSIDAWKEYENAVLVWLKRNVNDAEQLKDARQCLLRDICDYWLEKAPKWPSIGSYGETFTKDLDSKGEITNNNYIYLWSVLGTIQMQDYREAQYVFKAFIWGDPEVTLKCVKMDRHELNKWNQACIQDFEGVKAFADQAAEKSVGNIASKLKA